MCIKDTEQSLYPSTVSSSASQRDGAPSVLKRAIFWSTLVVLLATILSSDASSSLQNTRRRLTLTLQAFSSLATMPAEHWNEYYKSIDTVMVKGKIESEQDERLVGAWYRIVNVFCDLGNLEKMYIPPLVDPTLGLEDNQILIENKMALAAASGTWNASHVNRVGDVIPDLYKNRYVVHSETGKRSILPLSTRLQQQSPAVGYQVRDMDIVDLGCGKGRVLFDMMTYTGGKGSGINIDDSQLQNAMKFALNDHNNMLWPERLQLMKATFNDKLPFADESQDFVYEIGAFTYLRDKQAVFNEVYRILRPGGAFCYNDWTILDSFQPDDPVQVEKILQIRKFSGLIELHHPAELAAIAEKAGFEVVWNGHGGHMANPSSGLLSNMEDSFWYADAVMSFLIRWSILPKGLSQAWITVRAEGGMFTLKEAMDEKWLDVGHIFLIRKPH